MIEKAREGIVCIAFDIGVYYRSCESLLLFWRDVKVCTT